MSPNFGQNDREATVVEFAQRYRLRPWRDSDGTIVICGRHGHLFEYDRDIMGLMVLPSARRPKYWGHVRRKLLACGFRIQQDGDCEGAASFNPHNAMHAMAAIKAAGIKRIREQSPAQKEAAKRGLQAAMAARNRSRAAAKEGLPAVGRTATAGLGADITAPSTGD
jgi:hypothetical protein